MPRAAILVRRATLADAAAIARIMGDPAVFAGLLQMPLANEELWRQRLQGQPTPGNNDLQLVAELNGQVVGSAGLHLAPQLRRRHCAHLGISVDSKAQRQGVGLALMQALCDYADGWAQVLRIELTVFVDNLGAIALYERCGFRVEGTHRAYAMRDGVYADVLAMARLHPCPPSVGWPGGGPSGSGAA
jgi:L-phenylalanine/L-methionine N-acetyltransferase